LPTASLKDLDYFYLMPNDWVKIYTVEAAYKAELIKAVLKEEASITLMHVNKRDSMHTHLLNGGIELYVSPEDAIRAKHIISKNKL